MAASTLDSELFTLQDNWPGVAWPAHSVSAIGETSMKNDLAAAGRPVGSKIMYYNDGTAGKVGYSTLAYLQNHATINPMAVKDVCQQASATLWYQVTNDPDAAVATTGTGLAAICLAVTTESYYCWFWVGGVCPEGYISGLGGDYITDGNVAIGGMTCMDTITTDDMGFGVQSATAACCGHAISADA